MKNAEGVEVPSRASGEAVLEAAAKDTGPAADAIRELMEDPTPEKAKALMARLPELLPEDPALATVFADAMAEAYAGAVDLTRSGGGAEVANATDANGNEHGAAGSGKGGQFVSKGEGGADVSVGSVNSDPPEIKAKEKAKATAAFERCFKDEVDVPSAFRRSDIGDIDLRWGDDTKGLKHMLARRDAFAKAHPGEMDGKAVLAKMPETIIEGTITEVRSGGGHPSIAIEHGGFRAIITRDREGGNHWFMSGYEISEKGRGYRAKR